jgi:hypothetical protein
MWWKLLSSYDRTQGIDNFVNVSNSEPSRVDFSDQVHAVVMAWESYMTPPRKRVAIIHSRQISTLAAE